MVSFSAIFPYKNPYPESSTGQAVAKAMCGFQKILRQKKYFALWNILFNFFH